MLCSIMASTREHGRSHQRINRKTARMHAAARRRDVRTVAMLSINSRRPRPPRCVAAAAGTTHADVLLPGLRYARETGTAVLKTVFY